MSGKDADGFPYTDGINDIEQEIRRNQGLVMSWDTVKLTGIYTMTVNPVAGAAVLGGGVLGDAGAAGFRRYKGITEGDEFYDSGYFAVPVVGDVAERYHAGVEQAVEKAEQTYHALWDS